MAGETPTNPSTSTSGSAEQYNGNNGYTRPPVFEGENFEYWKDKLESYFLGLDGDLWDLLMDSYKHPVNSSGVKLTRQEMSDDQKKHFRNHHKCRTVFVATCPKNLRFRVATYSEGRIGNPTQYRDQGKILYSGRGKVLGTLNPFLLALNLRVKFYG